MSGQLIKIFSRRLLGSVPVPEIPPQHRVSYTPMPCSVLYLKPIHNLVSDATATSPMYSLALSTNGLNEFLVIVDVSVERPQRRTWPKLATEDIGFDPPWEDSTDLVTHECSCRDGEDIIEFLLSEMSYVKEESKPRWEKTYQGTLLRLWEEKEDHNQGDDVEASIKAKSSCWSHGVQHARERD